MTISRRRRNLLVIFLAAFMLPLLAGAQTRTWVAGSNTKNQGPCLDVGPSCPALSPGARARFGGIYAEEVRMFFAFGGGGCNSTNSCSSALNDLWALNVDSRAWKLIAGNPTNPPLDPQPRLLGSWDVPGMLGAGLTAFSGSGWNKHVYIAGGNSRWSQNWVWSFDLSSFLSGLDPNVGWQLLWGNASDPSVSDSDVYGERGVFAAANHPSGRYGHSVWTTDATLIWVYGGHPSYSSELWAFDIVLRQWAYMAGAQAVYQTNSQLGTRLQAGPLVHPGSWSHLAQMQPAYRPGDATDLMFFCGEGTDEAGDLRFLNVLMVYHVDTGEFEWLAGNQSGDSVRQPPAQGMGGPSTLYHPGSRWLSAGATDSLNGHVYIAYGNTDGSGVAEVWRYTPAADRYDFVDGADRRASANGFQRPAGESTLLGGPPGRYGAQIWVVHEATAKRQAGSAIDLWTFGGLGYDGVSGDGGLLNDVWVQRVPLDLCAGPPPFETEGLAGAEQPVCSNGVWFLPVVSATSGTVVIYGAVLVNGSLTLSPTTNISFVGVGASLGATTGIDINNATIVLVPLAREPTTFTPFTGAVSGTPGTVLVDVSLLPVVEDGAKNTCDTVDVRQASPSDFSTIVVTPQRSRCSGGGGGSSSLGGGGVAGIVVSALVVVALIVAACVVVIVAAAVFVRMKVSAAARKTRLNQRRNSSVAVTPSARLSVSDDQRLA